MTKHERAGSVADPFGNTERRCSCGATFRGDPSTSFENRDAHIRGEEQVAP